MILLLPLWSPPAAATTREAALDQAAAYATHSWTMDASNETASCDSGYASDYTAGTYAGLPYDWGGYVTLDEFDTQLVEGYGAGGHSWDGVLWCTTGVDCSGFVSEAWSSGHYATSTFYEVADDISASALERGDALNDAGSHMVLYTYETDAGTPVFYEASGSASKVRLNSSSGWSYLSGFQPIRYDGIEDGTSTGTVSDPREISSFPFTDLGWTAGAASDVLDVYNCASSTDESGPEMLYHFYTPTGGNLDVVVSDDSGVDIDVHVLTAPTESACLDRDDTEVEVAVPAGDVWLSLDTYVGSAEYPGPFQLVATFDGTVEGDSGTDTGGDSGTDTGTDSGTDSGADSGTDSGEDSGAADSDPTGDPPDSGTVDTGLNEEPGDKVKRGTEGGCATAPGGEALFGVLVGLAGLLGRRARRRG